jgi:hypothetical protein
MSPLSNRTVNSLSRSKLRLVRSRELIPAEVLETEVLETEVLEAA